MLCVPVDVGLARDAVMTPGRDGPLKIRLEHLQLRNLDLYSARA